MSLARAVGDGDVLVQLLHEFLDPCVLRSVRVGAAGLERLQGAQPHDGRVVAGEVVLAQQLADFQFHQLQQLLVVHHVDLVEGDDDARDLHLAREQDVLPRLGHRAVRRRDHEHRAVHLRRAGNHVLDVVGVAGAVDVRVVPVRRLVFDVGDVDRHAAGLLPERCR